MKAQTVDAGAAGDAGHGRGRKRAQRGVGGGGGASNAGNGAAHPARADGARHHHARCRLHGTCRTAHHSR